MNRNAPPIVIRGYAVPFNTVATIEGGEQEVVEADAFRAQIERGHHCCLQGNSHKRYAPKLARTGDGSLLLFADDFGLGFEARISPYDRNLAPVLSALVRRETAHCSVSFSRRKFETFN